MKLTFFYRDTYGSGGVPNEMASLYQALSQKIELTVWGKHGEHHLDNLPGCQLHTFDSLIDLATVFPKWLEAHRPDYIVVVGYFLTENLPVVYWARQHQIPVILYPLAQLMDEVFRGKIFTADPDVRRLEAAGSAQQSWVEQLKIVMNPLLKQLYSMTAGAWLMGNVAKVAVFSGEEQRQANSRYSDAEFMFLRWGVDEATGVTDTRHFFREVSSNLSQDDNRLNYVYWGRLDWYYKGIDRLLNGVAAAKKRNKATVLPFRVFLIGPDYRGGSEKAKEFIQRFHLEEDVILMLPGSYEAGSKTPLRDADASIYLSRWDGYPRTLRESILLQVPILISRETHFLDIAEKTGCGMPLMDADDPNEVAEALLALVDAKHRQHLKEQAGVAAPELTWGAVAKAFLKELVSDGLHQIPQSSEEHVAV
ncbi:MAG: glycosyltransferase [Vampirovibrio sp.]|nr:glycosyltransferase [Vampirovibrio sp.]